jgi:hypothetical protein
MHQVHLNYGNSISNSFDVNVQQMYSVNSGASFVNNGQTCVGCTSQCLNCNVRREGDFDCSGNGIGDVQEFNIQFTPNPASEYLMVTGVTLSTKITIYDLQGRVLMETELVSDETLSLNSLSPGLYMLSYENSAFRRTSRLIVASRR